MIIRHENPNLLFCLAIIAQVFDSGISIVRRARVPDLTPVKTPLTVRVRSLMEIDPAANGLVHRQ
jgi:hypothetical protein